MRTMRMKKEPRNWFWNPASRTVWKTGDKSLKDTSAVGSTIRQYVKHVVASKKNKRVHDPMNQPTKQQTNQQSKMRHMPPIEIRQ